MLGESLRRRQPRRRPPRTGGRRFDWRPLLVAIPLALVIPFLVGYLLAVRVIFPPPAISEAGIPVPDLVGGSVTDAERALATLGLGRVESLELPHPSAPRGQIVAQTPLPGQQLRPGAGVQVAVSGGQARVVVPDVVGFSDQRAAAMLLRSGFDVARAEEESAAAAGRVIRTEPGPGQEQVLPSTITMIISSGPPVALPDSVPPDTSAAPSLRMLTHAPR